MGLCPFCGSRHTQMTKLEWEHNLYRTCWNPLCQEIARYMTRTLKWHRGQPTPQQRANSAMLFFLRREITCEPYYTEKERVRYRENKRGPTRRVVR